MFIILNRFKDANYISEHRGGISNNFITLVWLEDDTFTLCL